MGRKEDGEVFLLEKKLFSEIEIGLDSQMPNRIKIHVQYTNAHEYQQKSERRTAKAKNAIEKFD